ncbi:hypothetical protein [Methanosarcina horonobensis]|nr:hypothetical protein [Methanosarcina horonobensis]
MEEKMCESLKSHKLPDYLLYTGVGGAKKLAETGWVRDISCSQKT